MRTAAEIRDRIGELETAYDEYDPPTSELADEREALILRSIAELEWVLGEREEPPTFAD